MCTYQYPLDGAARYAVTRPICVANTKKPRLTEKRKSELTTEVVLCRSNMLALQRENYRCLDGTNDLKEDLYDVRK